MLENGLLVLQILALGWVIFGILKAEMKNKD